MGHIQDRRNQGRGWVARYRTADGRERAKSFAKKVDAERYLSHAEVSKLDGSWVDPRLGRTPFREWRRIHQQTVTNLRPSTLARDESYFRNHIGPRFDAYPLASIEHLEVQEWVAELSTKLAPASVHKVHQILAKTLRAAVDAGYLVRNPCDRVVLPRIEKPEPRVLSPFEVGGLAGAIDQRYEALVVTAAHTGLRIGELLALRLDRVDLERRRVDVQETLVEVKGKLITNPPKTKQGRRVVPLTRAATRHLERHFDTQRVRQPDDFVFTSPEGHPIRLSLFRRRFWTPAVNAAGLSPLRIHDLRHTAISLWIAAGASPTEIARRAGHTSVVTVLDRYGHLLPGLDDRVTDALDALHDDAVGRPAAPRSVDRSSH